MTMNDEMLRRCKGLAQAAGCVGGFTADDRAADWIENIILGAAETAPDVLADPAAAERAEGEIVPTNIAADTAEEWRMMAQLQAWKAIDWDGLLERAWRTEPDPDAEYGGQTRTVACLAMIEPPEDLAREVLTRIGQRMGRLAMSQAIEAAAEAAEDEQEE